MAAATEKPANWFVRVLIVALCIFLGFLITYRFFYIAPIGELHAGVVTVLLLIVVLVLSESFDNFSVGKLLSLSRKVQQQENQVTDLKKENSDLRSQILAVANNVTQRQNSTNIVGFPDSVARAFRVTEAEQEEVRAKEKTRLVRQEASQTVTPSPARLDRTKMAKVALERFVMTNNLGQFPLVRDAKIEVPIENVDPISTDSPIFDAYIATLDAEIFVDVNNILGGVLFGVYRYQLYVELTKLYHYRLIKKSNIYLTAILVSENKDNTQAALKVIQAEFQPALSSGLLKLVEINLTEDEVNRSRVPAAPVRS